MADPPAHSCPGARPQAVCHRLVQHPPPLGPCAGPQAGQEGAGHTAQDGAGRDKERLRQVLQIQQRRHGVSVERQQGGVSQ